MSMLARLRRFWLDVHLWAGVGLLVPFVILGVTGSLLVWHDPLEKAFEPQRYAVSAGPALPLATHLTNARAAVGETFVVTALRPASEAGEPVVAQARAKGRPAEGRRPETRSVWLDPASGRVLDTANPRASAFGVMHVLHGSLMIPDIGRKVVGWMGWAMLASSLTGLWLWQPRNGALLKALRWKRGPRTTFNLHHFTGFWLAIPLAVLSLTGVYISFPQSARAVLGTFVALPAEEQRGGGRGPNPFGGPPPLARTNLTIDQAADAALGAAPGAMLVAINLPTGGRGDAAPSWRVQVRRAGAETPVNVQVSDETGEARVQGERGPPNPATQVARLMRRIHDGVDMGLPWQIIIFLGGWAPAVLGYTGIWMWLRRRAARRAVRRRIGAAEAGAAAASQAAE
ncbi:MAG: PepSY domain-containing protein [Hyphomonadaceae bacterium]|nr:PepSY domain-containing protein [Hyphomonadaceae bacterium]